MDVVAITHLKQKAKAKLSCEPYRLLPSARLSLKDELA